MTTELGPQPATSRDMPFWEWLIATGLIQGEAEYYAGGAAKEHAGAYGHDPRVVVRDLGESRREH